METEIAKLFTVKEVAGVLGISSCTVYRWCRKDWIDCVVLPNGTIRIKQDELDKIISGKD